MVDNFPESRFGWHSPTTSGLPWANGSWEIYPLLAPAPPSCCQRAFGIPCNSEIGLVVRIGNPWRRHQTSITVSWIEAGLELRLGTSSQSWNCQSLDGRRCPNRGWVSMLHNSQTLSQQSKDCRNMSSESSQLVWLATDFSLCCVVAELEISLVVRSTFNVTIKYSTITQLGNSEA